MSFCLSVKGDVWAAYPLLDLTHTLASKPVISFCCNANIMPCGYFGEGLYIVWLFLLDIPYVVCIL